jgi:hypothetical protein
MLASQGPLSSSLTELLQPPSFSELLQPQELGLTADMPNVKALAGELFDCVSGALCGYSCLAALCGSATLCILALMLNAAAGVHCSMARFSHVSDAVCAGFAASLCMYAYVYCMLGIGVCLLHI